MKKALLSGDYTNPLGHTFAGIDKELFSIYENDFDLTVTEHFESIALEGFDTFNIVILFTEHWTDKSQTVPELVPAMVRYLVMGGGLIILHSFDPAYDKEMAQIIGAKRTEVKQILPISYIPSDHTITKDMQGFTIDDEPYKAELDELLETEAILFAQYSGQLLPAAWCHTFGLGRVIVVGAGHRIDVYKNSEFKKFLVRCGLWAAKVI